MLQDYITDEEQGAVAGRNPISSINEVLREGRAIRDKSKVPLFTFVVMPTPTDTVEASV